MGVSRTAPVEAGAVAFRSGAGNWRPVGNAIFRTALVDYREWAIDVVFLGLPPLTCGLAWWSKLRKSRATSSPAWRKTAANAGLVLSTLSIGFGGFAYFYWREFPGTAPPWPTFVSTWCGLVLAVLALPLSVFSASWTRVGLVVCSITLLGFYFLMFLSP